MTILVRCSARSTVLVVLVSAMGGVAAERTAFAKQNWPDFEGKRLFERGIDETFDSSLDSD